YDVLEFFDRFQRALHDQRGSQLLLAGARLLAEAARRDLDVLRGDGTVHVLDRQTVAHQLRGIDPDPHGPFRREHLYPADPGNAADLVVDVTRGVIGQPDRVLVALLVTEGVDQQEVGAGLLHLQALRQHRLGQTRLGPL